MRFRRDPEESFTFELTSLIDVVFLLLIFFMVSTAFIDFSRSMDIELPESKASRVEERVRQFVIEMTLDDRIYLNGEEVGLDGLEKRLLEADGEETSVVIRADKRLYYGNVVKVLGLARAAQVSVVGIAVQ